MNGEQLGKLSLPTIQLSQYGVDLHDKEQRITGGNDSVIYLGLEHKALKIYAHGGILSVNDKTALRLTATPEQLLAYQEITRKAQAVASQLKSESMHVVGIFWEIVPIDLVAATPISDILVPFTENRCIPGVNLYNGGNPGVEDFILERLKSHIPLGLHQNYHKVHLVELILQEATEQLRRLTGEGIIEIISPNVKASFMKDRGLKFTITDVCSQVGEIQVK